MIRRLVCRGLLCLGCRSQEMPSLAVVLFVGLSFCICSVERARRHQRPLTLIQLRDVTPLRLDGWSSLRTHRSYCALSCRTSKETASHSPGFQRHILVCRRSYRSTSSRSLPCNRMQFVRLSHASVLAAASHCVQPHGRFVQPCFCNEHHFGHIWLGEWTFEHTVVIEVGYWSAA